MMQLEKDAIVLMIVAIIAIIAAVVIVIINFYRTNRTMNNIEKMLIKAQNSENCETEFDENRLSRLETLFSNYLSSSVVSSKNTEKEKKKIETLIADISHQTKTPIANLLLYSELLYEDNLDESTKKNVDVIHNQTERLRFLIDSLVKLSRLENGILALHPQSEQIQPMLSIVYNQYIKKATDKGLKLTVLPTNLSAIFDAKWTTEAICNLVDNAIKYTAHGEIRLSVISYEFFTRIDIKDTGVGISEEDQAKIFSRFYRSQNTNETEGVGIGLYLARKILSEEGGYIKISSKVGEGSTFSVFLPNEKKND